MYTELNEAYVLPPNNTSYYTKTPSMTDKLTGMLNLNTNNTYDWIHLNINKKLNMFKLIACLIFSLYF